MCWGVWARCVEGGQLSEGGGGGVEGEGWWAKGERPGAGVVRGIRWAAHVVLTVPMLLVHVPLPRSATCTAKVAAAAAAAACLPLVSPGLTSLRAGMTHHATLRAGLFKGNLASCLKVGPSNAIRVSTYEAVKDYLSARHSHGHGGHTEDCLSTSDRLLAGSISGGLATLITHPLDVVKTQMAMTGRGGGMWCRTPSGWGGCGAEPRVGGGYVVQNPEWVGRMWCRTPSGWGVCGAEPRVGGGYVVQNPEWVGPWGVCGDILRTCPPSPLPPSLSSPPPPNTLDAQHQPDLPPSLPPTHCAARLQP